MPLPSLCSKLIESNLWKQKKNDDLVQCEICEARK